MADADDFPYGFDARDAGGKGQGILLLKESGFKVPECVLFSSSQIANWLGLRPGFNAAIRDWALWSGDAASGPATLTHFRAELRSAPMPARWPEHSAEVIRRLGSAALIVRSSMSAEDGSTVSFAGAFRSIAVMAATPSALWTAVTEVLASAFEPAAALQVLSAGIHPRDFKPGFLIQKFISAELAGVCFSRAPETIWQKSGVVEWARGPGESVVQGSVETRTEYQSQGLAPDSALRPFWEELWSAAARAEAVLGEPADLEWVWSEGTLWFVQLRPVATEEARLLAQTPEGGRWSRALSLERFPEPITPLGWSTIADTLGSNLDTLREDFGIEVNGSRAMAVRLRSRIYSDPDYFAFPSRVKVRWSRYLLPWRGHLPSLLRALARFVANRLRGARSEVTRALLKVDLVQALVDPQARHWQDRWTAHVETGMQAIAGFKSQASDADELIARMEDLRAISLKFLEPDFTVFLIKDTLHKALEALWQSLGKSPLDFAELINAFDGNRTLEMSREWSELVSTLARDPQHAEFLRRLRSSEAAKASDCLAENSGSHWRRFLERNGHNRTTWDIALPCWSEAPETLAPLLAASLPGGRAADGTSERQTQAIQLLREALREKGMASAIPRLLGALERLKDFMRMDEELHFLTGHLLEPSRELILAAGRVLAEKGILGQVEDVFYLELAELKRALAKPELNLRFLAARRKAEFERAWKTPGLFEFPPTENQTSALPPAPDGALRGVPVSPGVAEGDVLVAEHLGGLGDGELRPGAILVTTAPNPAFVPLYPLLAGIVSTTGGILSHGFVAAREFGVPAVSGITDAPTVLKSGTRVRIDGERGLVEILRGAHG